LLNRETSIKDWQVFEMSSDSILINIVFEKLNELSKGGFENPDKLRVTVLRPDQIKFATNAVLDL